MSAKEKSTSLLDRERRNILNRRLKFFGVLFLFIAVLIGVCYLVFFSDLVKVKSVNVIGNESVSKEEIIGIVNEEILERRWVAKLLGSDNILSWWMEESFQLGDRFPEISLVTVTSKLTDRIINIEVDERNKFAIWCEGKCFWIDDQGVIFERAPEVQGSLVRTIKVMSDRSLELGEKPLVDRETDNLVKIVNFLESFDFIATKMSIEDLEFKEITVKTSDGPMIYFNLLIDPYFGRSVINSLQESGTWSRVDYLDLRVDGRAYYNIK